MQTGNGSFFVDRWESCALVVSIKNERHRLRSSLWSRLNHQSQNRVVSIHVLQSCCAIYGSIGFFRSLRIVTHQMRKLVLVHHAWAGNGTAKTEQKTEGGRNFPTGMKLLDWELSSSKIDPYIWFTWISLELHFSFTCAQDENVFLLSVVFAFH